MFGIQFAPSREGASFVMQDERYRFTQRDLAEKVADYLNGVNNPAWIGNFTVTELPARA